VTAIVALVPPSMGDSDVWLRSVSRQLGGTSGPLRPLIARSLNKRNAARITAALETLGPMRRTKAGRRASSNRPSRLLLCGLPASAHPERRSHRIASGLARTLCRRGGAEFAEWVALLHWPVRAGPGPPPAPCPPQCFVGRRSGTTREVPAPRGCPSRGMSPARRPSAVWLNRGVFPGDWFRKLTSRPWMLSHPRHRRGAFGWSGRTSLSGGACGRAHS
jgi:hypothetical protein